MIPQKRCLEGTSSNRFYTCSSCNIKQNNMYLSSCGCFYCESCVKCLPEKHETCFSKSNKENFLLLEKQEPCKYQDQGCNSGAQFICKCIKNGFVCGSCFIELHVRRVDAPCLPVKIKNKNSSSGNCEDCGTFIAEFKVIDENKKVCIDCKIKYKNLEKIIDDEFDWEKISKELEVTKNILNCKKKKINTLLEYRKSIFNASHAKFDEVLEKMKGDFAQHKKTFDHENQELVSCFDQIKKFEKNIGIDGSISQVITEAKKNLLEINGGYSALSALLKSYRDHDIPSFKIKQIKFDFIQHEDSHQYMISFDTQEVDHAEATSSQLDDDCLETDEVLPSSRITRSVTPIKASKQIQEIQWQEYSSENDTTASTSRTLTLLDTNDPVCVQITRILSPFYICIEIPELVETRNEILEIIRSKENEWTPLASFGYNDIVIVSDEYAVKNKKKRGKIKYVNRIKEQVRVYLLDFGFDIMVPFKRIGMYLNSMYIE